MTEVLDTYILAHFEAHPASPIRKASDLLEVSYRSKTIAKALRRVDGNGQVGRRLSRVTPSPKSLLFRLPFDFVTPFTLITKIPPLDSNI